MGRPGISYTDVAHAAQEIIASGKHPTIEAIRFKIKTGSSTTIAQHLRTWKAQQESAQIASKDNLPEECVALMKGLWERLISQADEQIQLVKQDCKQTVTQLTEELTKTQQENQQQQRHNEQLKNEYDVLLQEKKSLDQLLNHFQTEQVALQTKQAGLVEQLQERQARIEELNRLNHQVQNNLEHYRQASLEQRQQDLRTAETQKNQLEQQVLQLKQALTHQQQESLHWQQQAEQAAFQKDTLEAELNSLIQTHEKLQNQSSKQNESFIKLQKQQAGLEQKLVDSQRSLKELIAEKKQLTAEKWTIGQERAILEGQLKQMEIKALHFKEPTKTQE